MASSTTTGGGHDRRAGDAASPKLSALSDDRPGQATLAVLGDLHLEPDNMALFTEAREQARRGWLGSPVHLAPLGRRGRTRMSAPLDVARFCKPPSPSYSCRAPPTTAARMHQPSLSNFLPRPPSPQVRSVLSAGGPSSLLVQLGDLGGYASQPGSRECFDRAAAFLAGFGRPAKIVLGNHDLEGIKFQTDAANIEAWREALGQEVYWEEKVGGHVLIGLSTTRFREAPGSCHEVRCVSRRPVASRA